MHADRIMLVISGILLIAAVTLYCTRAHTAVERKTWLYQLQNADVNAIAASGFPMVVMDPTRDGTAKSAYTAAEIARLTRAGILPIAYISIGEASLFRSYWDSDWATCKTDHGGNKVLDEITDEAPDWIGTVPNPSWPESVKVRYWDPEWRDEIIAPQLNDIIAAGFSGAYLDIVDAFEYWGSAETYGPRKEMRTSGDPINEKDAALRMIRFVRWIAAYCRERSPGFAVYPQNGENILQYDANGAYLDAISGIGIEDLWYNAAKPNTDNWVNNRIRYLKKITAQNKPVLSVDYVDDKSGYAGANKSRIDEYIARCTKEGFRYFVGTTDRELKTMNVIPGILP